MEYAFLVLVALFLVVIFSSFNPSSTKKISEDIYVIRSLFVNFYILKKGNHLVLFDTGMSAAVAVKGIEKLNLDPNDVTHILLTHTDRDHAGGVAAFPNAVVIMSSEEEQMINGQTAKKLFIHNRKPREIYQLMENNDILEIDGLRIKLILTPGHTTGSSIYLIDDEICVTGDLLRVTRSGEMKIFLRLMNKNHKESKESLAQQTELLKQAKMILSGHTGVYIRN
ncbi:MAG: MBL fold metallo-hydrolase [Oscillospiraceae bacterium]|nr:MBL fold metallo-hydrolase [Oscillospiraceae bacterium]